MTFKELANYILTLPEDIQNSEAAFANLDEDTQCVALSGENNKLAMIKDKTIAPMIFGCVTAYSAILSSDDEIHEEYDHFIDGF
jgi:hypothetical protein